MISPAQPHDEPALKQLYNAAFKLLRDRYVPTGRSPSLPSEPRCITLKFDGQIRGALSYYPDPPHLRLFKLAVHPASQGQGIATSLINYAADQIAKPKGLDLAVYVITESGNIAFFRKLGFAARREVVAEYAESPNGGYVHETEMTKPVTQQADPADRAWRDP